MIRGRGRNADDLSAQPLHQRGILTFRVANQDIVIGNEKSVADFSLGAEGFAAVVYNKSIGKHKIQMFWNTHIIDRYTVHELVPGDMNDSVTAAEKLTRAHFLCLHILSPTGEDQMLWGAFDHAAIHQFKFKQLVHIPFDTDILGWRCDDCLLFFIVGFYQRLLDAGIHQLRKGHRSAVCKENLCIARAAAGSTKDQPIGVFQQLPVNHDKVVGKGVDAVIQGFLSCLEQLLGGKGNEDRHTGGSQTTLDIDVVHAQGQTAHNAFFLLIVQSHQGTIMLLGNGFDLEDVVIELPGIFRGIHNQEGQKEHSLVSALKILQQLFCFCTVGGKVGRNDVHVISGTNSFLLFFDLGTV